MSKEPNLQLLKGDHVKVRRTLYYHHGIYCGYGEVIHYFVSNGCGVVTRHSLNYFTRGGTVKVARYKSLSAEKVIKRAESRIREKQYNLLFNNCEHFAYWCKTGEAKSPQVEVIFNTINIAMNPFIFVVAKDIYRIYWDEKEKTSKPEHLPQPILILFQRFKKAYERKNIIELKDSISSDFDGDIYGKTKTDFIKFMEYNFNYLKYGVSPHLVIEVYNICSSSDAEFSAVINMKANLQFLGIVTPAKWDGGKLYCEAKAEGDFNYWRITKLTKFRE